MGQRELLVKRDVAGGVTVSSMDGGKGDGGLAFWMLEVGWRGWGGSGRRRQPYRALVRMLEVRTLLLYSMSSVMFYDLA